LHIWGYFVESKCLTEEDGLSSKSILEAGE